MHLWLRRGKDECKSLLVLARGLYVFLFFLRFPFLFLYSVLLQQPIYFAFVFFILILKRVISTDAKMSVHVRDTILFSINDFFFFSLTVFESVAAHLSFYLLSLYLHFLFRLTLFTNTDVNFFAIFYITHAFSSVRQ